MREARVRSLGQEDPLEEEPLLIRDFLLLSIQFLPLSDGCASLQTLFSLPQRVSHRTHCVLRSLSAQNDWQVPRTMSKKTCLPISGYLEDVLCCKVFEIPLKTNSKTYKWKKKEKINLVTERVVSSNINFFHPVIYWINTYFGAIL